MKKIISYKKDESSRYEEYLGEIADSWGSDFSELDPAYEALKNKDYDELKTEVQKLIGYYSVEVISGDEYTLYGFETQEHSQYQLKLREC